jgi:voltage-gated potassium channel Kch
MASVYGGIDLLTDTTFLNNVVTEDDYLYFPFVTLTTVGYGDITAASDLAKRLVVAEAFVGQVFIITLVARLVSLWGTPLRR